MVSESSIQNLVSIFTSYIGSLQLGNNVPLDTVGIRKELETIFPEKTCSNVILTNNTDKMFFGIYLNPTIMIDDVITILFTDDDFVITRYALEIDSKLFNIGLDAEEMVAYLLYEVSSLVDNAGPVWNVRNIIDVKLAEEDEVIDIKSSVNYSQILILGIKDVIEKVTSIKYTDNDGILSNSFVNTNDLRDFLISGANKIRTSVFGVGTSVEEPKLILLNWAFNLYRDAAHFANRAIYMLDKSKQFTGSVLKAGEVDKTIKCLRRLNFEIANEAATVLNEAKKKKGSLFSNLKKNGLRTIEDDLYEYSLRVKNASSEEDAYYAMRQINTRLAMIEDYLENTDMSESEYERWSLVAKQYRELRATLAAKKISKKSYGLYFDYSKLDHLDDE